MKKVEYMTYIPGGNNTAFVSGIEYTAEERKKINDAIMLRDTSIEQVGFLRVDKAELIMAGGEFCGNATRSAAMYYLGKPGIIILKVNQKDYIKAGVDEFMNAWCEIPLYTGEDAVTFLENGINLVKMNGMVTVVIDINTSTKYLQKKDELKSATIEIIHKYKLTNNEAVGVMFLEMQDNMLKINPVVWVNSINTLFCETACGSGTVAIAIIEAYNTQMHQSIDILQPSGYVITAKVQVENKKVTNAIISGKVYSDSKLMYVDVDLD